MWYWGTVSGEGGEKSPNLALGSASEFLVLRSRSCVGAMVGFWELEKAGIWLAEWWWWEWL